jgi:type II restriction enzyme
MSTLPYLAAFLPADSRLKASQRVRVMSEEWAASLAYCPACGSPLEKLKAGLPVADFRCSGCPEEYELKSKAGSFGKKIVDGAYATMMQRLASDTAPNLLLLSYEKASSAPLAFLAIPKGFFRPLTIERRKPLAATARRAGWVGCNILLSEIPEAGRICLVEQATVRPKQEVMHEWRLAGKVGQKRAEMKGWLLDVMLCIDALGQEVFTLNELYAFEEKLALRHPGNSHIREKIRQQLQVLRDLGYLHFETRGNYRLSFLPHRH